MGMGCERDIELGCGVATAWNIFRPISPRIATPLNSIFSKWLNTQASLFTQLYLPGSRLSFSHQDTYRVTMHGLGECQNTDPIPFSKSFTQAQLDSFVVLLISGSTGVPDSVALTYESPLYVSFKHGRFQYYHILLLCSGKGNLST